MKRFSRTPYWILLLLALLIVPVVHAQDTSDQILVAVQDMKDGKGPNTIYTINADDGLKTKIGIVNNFGSEAGWSPKGKFIYLLDHSALDHRTLSVVDVETNQHQTIPDPLDSNLCSLPVWWSPNDEWVSYSTASGSQTLLKIFNPTSGETRVLTDADTGYEDLSWSYDGRYLAYHVISSADNLRVVIVDVQKQQTVLELHVGSVYEFLLWSPTEDQFVVTANDSSDSRVYNLTNVIYNLSDGTKQEYTGGRLGQWSPDGHFVTLYHEDKNRNISLLVIDVLSQKRIEFDGDIDAAGVEDGAVWSSDGRYLAMVKLAPDKNYQGTIYILDVLKGSSQRLKIDAFTYNSFSPFVWSPVGHQLAFASNPVMLNGIENYTSLWLFDTDRGQAHQYTAEISTSIRQDIDWFTDASALIVQTISGVALLDQGSEHLNPIGTSLHLSTYARWWRNGTKLALSSYIGTMNDIYVFASENQTLKNVTNTPDEVKIFLGWRGADKGDGLIFPCGEG